MLIKQGFKPGKCLVESNKKKERACESTFKIQNGEPYRLIKSAHLSRPEHYFSIYQSGCNMGCLKCHSWEFSQCVDGSWFSPDDILHLAEEYAETVTFFESRERATSYHAMDLCRGCGSCVEVNMMDVLFKKVKSKEVELRPTGKRSQLCPNRLNLDQIVLSPQGIGPARNIIAFTGGDLGCKPDFYVRCSERIREKELPLWILFETNGYGLTPIHLDMLKKCDIDSFWLDIKAYDLNVHKRLTGVSNEWILKLPEEMIKRNFVVEILTLFIPGWVEQDQIRKIAEIVSSVDKRMPFTILAFFPEFKLKDTPSPDLHQMLLTYEMVKETGLKNVRLANLGVFVKNDEDLKILLATVND